MRRRNTRKLALCIGLSLAVTSITQTPSEGKEELYRPGSALQSTPLRVEVIDGTRFRDIESHVVYRLYGIDTCAPDQTASLARQPWPCGTVAIAWLVEATLNKWIACNTLREVEGEHLARCSSAQHADLGADMLRDGLAVTVAATEHEQMVRSYTAAELEARKNYRGIWSSSFEMPWDFRAHDAAKTSVTKTDGAP